MLYWIDLFSSLSEEEIQTLSAFCQLRNVKPLEVIFNEWDESTAMYVLKKWLLQAYKWAETLWDINEWEFFWEMALFWNSNLRMASVRALMDSQIIVLLDFSINQLKNSNPEIIAKIKEVINERNELNNRKKN